MVSVGVNGGAVVGSGGLNICESFPCPFGDPIKLGLYLLIGLIAIFAIYSFIKEFVMKKEQSLEEKKE